MVGTEQGASDTSSSVSFCLHATIEAMGCSCILQMNMLRLLPFQLWKRLVSGVRENETGRAGFKARVIVSGKAYTFQITYSWLLVPVCQFLGV